MASLMVPVDTLVPISKFGRGGASAEFAKVDNGRPVTVLRNNEPVYFIINQHDFQHYRDLEDEVRELRNEQARRDVATKEYTHSFDNVNQLEDYFDAI
ncbi:prevent-host-death family protein [Bifidobacterium cebidarum]|uniref:Type II toxin-antitoxin system n=1 Tax=Bifidobacterium cebidarum TaxID=2650773 RepID=A0A6I1GAK4_9BIFI|nr:prevent-host-death family protein [Bifidobacterium cebidarum]KAB7788600.1 type II toxin-antitoxin system [Bifidobacterium cebidarum]